MIRNRIVQLYDSSIYVNLPEDTMQFDSQKCSDKGKSLMTKEHMKTSSLVLAWP